MFAWISRRCNEATGFNATPFHCISITLVEIIGQLPSITDQVLYHNVLALYQNKKHQTIRVRKLFLLYNNRSCWISTSSQWAIKEQIFNKLLLWCELPNRRWRSCSIESNVKNRRQQKRTVYWQNDIWTTSHALKIAHLTIWYYIPEL